MFDLATAKVRLGIAPGDTTSDVLINSALETALAVAERYCDRQFGYAAQRAIFRHVHGSKLQLRRFPVEQVIQTDPEVQYQVHHVTGVIEFHNPQILETFAFDYAGGYKVLPPDLELAMWQVFGVVYGQAAGGGATVQAGEIQSVTLADVGTVRFSTSADAAKAAASGGSALIPATAASILDTYRLEKA